MAKRFVSREQRHQLACSRLFAHLGGAKAGHRIEKGDRFGRQGKTLMYHVDEVWIGWESEDLDNDKSPTSGAQKPRKRWKGGRTLTDDQPPKSPEALPRNATRYVDGIPEGQTAQEWQQAIADLLDRSDPEGHWH